MNIRREQLEAIAAAWERMHRAQLTSRLREEFGSRVPIQDQELQRKVEEGIRAAARLGIVADRELYRFLRLMFLGDWNRPGAQELAYKVVSDASLPATERLDFIERALLNLPPCNL